MSNSRGLTFIWMKTSQLPGLRPVVQWRKYPFESYQVLFVLLQGKFYGHMQTGKEYWHCV